MEKSDVLDEYGNLTGETKERSLVHKDGDWHRAVHIWFINSKGELLIQKRAAKKVNWPNHWDISVGGHVEAGQTTFTAAIREIKEETGFILTPEDLEFLFTQKHSSIHGGKNYNNNEFDETFLVSKEFDIDALSFSRDEISEFKFIPWRELKEKVAAKDPILVPHEQYKRLFKILEQKGY